MNGTGEGELMTFDRFSPLIGSSVGVLGVWVVSRLSGRPLIVLNPKSFPELSGLSEEDQQRLLREASRLAFQRRTSLLPVLVLFVSFGAGMVIAQLLSTMFVSLD